MQPLIDAIRTQPDAERILRKIRDSKPPHADITDSYRPRERAAAVRATLKECDIEQFTPARNPFTLGVRVSEGLRDRVVEAYARVEKETSGQTSADINLDKALDLEEIDFGGLDEILEKIRDARPGTTAVDSIDELDLAKERVAALAKCGIEATIEECEDGPDIRVAVDFEMRRRVRSAFARSDPNEVITELEAFTEKMRERRGVVDAIRRATLLDYVLAECVEGADEIVVQCDAEERAELIKVVDEETDLVRAADEDRLIFRLAPEETIQERKRMRAAREEE
jgi:hypothetical protein